MISESENNFRLLLFAICEVKAFEKPNLENNAYSITVLNAPFLLQYYRKKHGHARRTARLD